MTREVLLRYCMAGVQLAGTLAIIVLLQHHTIWITALLFVWWGFMFYPLSKQEILLFCITCIFFTGADISVLHQGVFAFRDNDILGMPYYELFMWGFYFLNASRLLKGNILLRYFPGLVFAVVAVIKISIPNVTVALLTCGAIVIAGLVYFGTKKDVEYTLYMTGMGLVVEFIGTRTGTWSYTIDNYFFWWIVTWAVSGLVLYRAIMPLTHFITIRYFRK